MKPIYSKVVLTNNKGDNSAPRVHHQDNITMAIQNISTEKEIQNTSISIKDNYDSMKKQTRLK